MLSLHTDRLTKGLGGKIKGRGTGTLACFFSFLSLALFKDWKGSFKPLRIVLEQALCWRNCYIKTLPTKWYNSCGSKHQFVFILKLYDWWQRRKSRLLLVILCLLWITFFHGGLWPCHQALCISAHFDDWSSNQCCTLHLQVYKVHTRHYPQAELIQSHPCAETDKWVKANWHVGHHWSRGMKKLADYILWVASAVLCTKVNSGKPRLTRTTQRMTPDLNLARSNMPRHCFDWCNLCGVLSWNWLWH